MLDVELAAPAYTAPSTQAFIDLALAGLAWGMQPIMLADGHLASGRLVELKPRSRIDVALHWTVARLPVASLRHLTEAVRSAASKALS